MARLTIGEGPVIATAIHEGHEVRPELEGLLALDEAQRLREEDPFTGEWTVVAPTQVVGRRSRFEVDLNRPRDGAVYVTPEQSWGLQVWKQPLPPDVLERSLAEYDAFYQGLGKLLEGYAQRYGKFVVYDLHTYNHRRDGLDAPPADPAKNPEVNLGTGTMQPGRRDQWAGVVEAFMGAMRQGDPLNGRSLDVRENVKFKGGYFAKWIHARFPDAACVLSIEFKKVFMDEWTGEANRAAIEQLKRALAATVPGVLEALSSS